MHFELTWRPSRALNLDAYVASELQRNKVSIRCGALDAEVPGHRTEQLMQTLMGGVAPPLLEIINLMELCVVVFIPNHRRVIVTDEN